MYQMLCILLFSSKPLNSAIRIVVNDTQKFDTACGGSGLILQGVNGALAPRGEQGA